MKPLEAMSKEELQALIRAEHASQTPDEALLWAALEQLEAREEQDEAEREAEIDAAWQDFQSFVHTKDGRRASMIGEAPSVPRKRSPFMRYVAAAAVVALLLSCAVPPAVGAGKAGSLIGRWTNNVFWFDSRGTMPTEPGVEMPAFRAENEGLRRMQEAIGDKLPGPAVPAWIPEGFATTEFTDVLAGGFRSEEEEHFEVSGYFECGERQIEITVYVSSKPANTVYAKDDVEVTVYSRNGTEYHIMPSEGQYICAWFCGSYGGSIKGDLSLEELYRMIDSICLGQ